MVTRNFGVLFLSLLTSSWYNFSYCTKMVLLEDKKKKNGFYWTAKIVTGWGKLLLGDKNCYWTTKIVLMEGKNCYWTTRIVTGRQELLLNDKSAAHFQCWNVLWKKCLIVVITAITEMRTSIAARIQLSESIPLMKWQP